MLAQVKGTLSCHAQNASLCCGVSNNIRHAPHANCRGHVDNRILWCHGFCLPSSFCNISCFVFCLSYCQCHMLDPICVRFDMKRKSCIPVYRDQSTYQGLQPIRCICCRMPSASCGWGCCMPTCIKPIKTLGCDLPSKAPASHMPCYVQSKREGKIGQPGISEVETMQSVRSTLQLRCTSRCASFTNLIRWTLRRPLLQDRRRC